MVKVNAQSTDVLSRNFAEIGAKPYVWSYLVSCNKQKRTGRLTCRVLPMVQYRYRCSGIAPSTREATYCLCNNYLFHQKFVSEIY